MTDQYLINFIVEFYICFAVCDHGRTWRMVEKKMVEHVDSDNTNKVEIMEGKKEIEETRISRLFL